MTIEESETQPPVESRPSGVPARQVKPRLARPLPTDRVGFEKQLDVLRGYAKASVEAGGQAVGNNDVAERVHMHMGSVSSCNPFFIEIGLLQRDGVRNRPSQAVIDYDAAVQWSPEKAAWKLAPIIEQSWFGQVMLRRLSLRASMPKSAAIEVLAEEARAGKEYKLSLEMLLEYLKVAGVITYDGTTVQRATRSEDVQVSQPTGPSSVNSAGTPTDSHRGLDTAPVHTRNVERFSIPLPGKESVVIEMPKDMDSDDWMMLGSMLAQYIRRWKKYKAPEALIEATSGDDEEAQAS